MRTREYESKKNDDKGFTKRHIDRMRYAGIFKQENELAARSCPKYADSIISGLITLNSANLLTDENRRRISTYPEQAWTLARAIVGLVKNNLFDFNTWSLLINEFLQMAPLTLSLTHCPNNFDISLYLSQNDEENINNIKKK